MTAPRDRFLPSVNALYKPTCVHDDSPDDHICRECIIDLLCKVDAEARAEESRKREDMALCSYDVIASAIYQEIRDGRHTQGDAENYIAACLHRIHGAHQNKMHAGEDKP